MEITPTAATLQFLGKTSNSSNNNDTSNADLSFIGEAQAAAGQLALDRYTSSSTDTTQIDITDLQVDYSPLLNAFNNDNNDSNNQKTTSETLMDNFQLAIEAYTQNGPEIDLGTAGELLPKIDILI